MEAKSESGESRPRRRRNRKRARSGPVPLHKRTGSHFQPSDRQRGSEYFREDRVRLDIDGARVRAHVEGNDRPSYSVGVDWSQVASDRILHAFCDCPRFASGGPCKHVWATLLALAESGAENQPKGRDRLSLRRDTAAGWSDLGVTTARVPPTPRRVRSDRRSRRGARPVAPASWRAQFEAVLDQSVAPAPQVPEVAGRARAAVDIQLLVNTAASAAEDALVLDVFSRGVTAKGKPAKLKRAAVETEELVALLGGDEASAESREALAVVAALPPDPPPKPRRGRRGRRKPSVHGVRRFRLPESLYEAALPRLAQQGALGWWDGRSLREAHPLVWDGGPPWRLALRFEMAAGTARLSGELLRRSERFPLGNAPLILSATDERGALVLVEDSLAPFAASGPQDFAWISVLNSAGEIAIPSEDLEEAMTSLLEIPNLPHLEVPEELDLLVEQTPPVPRLVLDQPPAPEFMTPPLVADLSFDYGGLGVRAEDARMSVIDWSNRRFVRRDMESEHAALLRLLELGMRPVEAKNGHALELGPAQLPGLVEPLLTEGWSVEVHGTAVRRPSLPALKVESGIDWFELSGEIDFDGDRIDLSELLGAVSRGERFLRLADGSKGLLPAAWMETYDSLSGLAHSASNGGLRFLPSQALLVDALLTAMPPANVDKGFAELRDKLRSFDRIKPKRELKSFVGELRGYQRGGLGWLTFLREFGLGGVLADDMGLGKTVQVLALVQAHRTSTKSTDLPWLVVAPRSVVYNWIEEAAHFTPNLRVVEYLGTERETLHGKLDEYDVVVTTYGTLRLDVAYLATVEFDTVILDEAQAIKNPSSQTAKASRLLRARNRLALTGTPIENHLGELGSLFEFLNPGLLGRLPWLDVLASGRAASQRELEVVADGIRPFILRRTKAQVLPDLPPKTEQVLHCELRPEQRKLYNQLRAQYQASLLDQVERQGVGGAAIQVLQALLRLRQVACHPGLVDPQWEEAGSAKLEALFEQVEEVLEEGHKVLVFSQFVKLLAYVRRHLEEANVPYAYLDGQTRDRAAAVDRFQNDPDCNLFLVSLKAGGTGLNLTAAGYVFLLDPWWNPAVEAQAIDRAHRIGQTQPVFAYRLIARDTVEEKILELQGSKRRIADAILEGEGQSLRDLTADDLRLLLS
jgi:superfamily II DNA or RNA helicase